MDISSRFPSACPNIVRLNHPASEWQYLTPEDIMAEISADKGLLLSSLKFESIDINNIGQARVPTVASMLDVFDSLQALAAKGIRVEHISAVSKAGTGEVVADWNSFRLVTEDKDPLEATLRLASGLTFTSIPAEQIESEIDRVKATRANLAQALWHCLSMKQGTSMQLEEDDVGQLSLLHQRLSSLVDRADRLNYIFNFDNWFETVVMDAFREDLHRPSTFIPYSLAPGSVDHQLIASKIWEEVLDERGIIPIRVRQVHDWGGNREMAKNILYYSMRINLLPKLLALYMISCAKDSVGRVKPGLLQDLESILRYIERIPDNIFPPPRK